MTTTTINHNHKRKHVKMIGITLGVFLAIGGSMLTAPGTTHAATGSKTTATTATASKDAASETSVVDNIIATGEQYLGVDYKFGAKSGITSAFDCSSFMQYIFKENGIDLPRTSRQQALVGTKVAKADLQPGDLVFTDTNKDGKINHVSLYIGDGKLLQTYRVGIGVTISDFDGSVWDRTFVTARHVIDAGNEGDTGSDTGSGSDENVGGDTGTDNNDTGTDTDNGSSNTDSDADNHNTDKPNYGYNR